MPPGFLNASTSSCSILAEVLLSSWIGPPTAQVNEVLCKILAHNLTVLIQSWYELGIEAQFGTFGIKPPWLRVPFYHGGPHSQLTLSRVLEAVWNHEALAGERVVLESDSFHHYLLRPTARQ